MPRPASIAAATPPNRVQIPLFPRLFLSGLTLAFLAAGIGLFAEHLAILRTWRPVEATVARAEVIQFQNNKQRDMYRGEVELAYTIAGQRYQTPETFSYSSTDESSIRDNLETTYAPGTRHRVFHNPANPHALRWNVGPSAAFFLLPLLFSGVGLILVGVCWLLWRLPFPPRLHCGRCGNEGRIDDRHCPRCGDLLRPSTPVLSPVASEGSADHDANDANDASEEELEIPPPPRRENPQALILTGAFFGLPGVACLFGAVYLGMNTYAATQTWPTAQATVTRGVVETTRSRDGMPTYRLAVEFQYEGSQQSERATGQSIYVSASFPWIAQRLAGFAEGSRHTIRVNPRNAADIRFDTQAPLLNWLPTAGVGVLGLIFAAIGAALLRWGMRPRCVSCRHPLRGAAFCAACGVSLAAKAVTI